MDNVTIGIVCTVVGAVATFITQKRNFKQDAEVDASTNIKMETKIDYISKEVYDIRLDIKSQDRKISDVIERVVRVEESTKSAHRRIDELLKEE